jgi:hypothetical protein
LLALPGSRRRLLAVELMTRLSVPCPHEMRCARACSCR